MCFHKFLPVSKKKIVEVLPFFISFIRWCSETCQASSGSFASISILRGGLPEIKNIISLIDKTSSLKVSDVQKATICAEGIFPVRSIGLSDVHYMYPGSSKPVLKGINIDIPVGSRVAFVGPSGSGKTTAANILLSLLHPQKGALVLDGIALLESEIPTWHKCCAKVPQSIQLLSDSIISNVIWRGGTEIDEDKSGILFLPPNWMNLFPNCLVEFF